MRRDEDLLFRQAQPLGKNPHQSGVEGEGTALKDHGAGDLQALGQAADGLLGDGVEGGEGQVGLGHPLVEEGLDVGLGVDAAPAGDVVDAGAPLRQGVKLLNRHLQQGGDLVDEGPGAAGAAAVHAHIGHGEGAGVGIGLEEDHLGVLAAQLDGAAHLLIPALQGGGVGRHLLGKGNAQALGDGLGPRPGQAEAEGLAGEPPLQLLHHPDDALDLVGVVPPIVGI